MELNRASLNNLTKVNRKLNSKLVGYTRKNYTCEVTKDGTHKFYNEKQESYKVPFFFKLKFREKLYKNCLEFYDKKMGSLEYSC